LNGVSLLEEGSSWSRSLKLVSNRNSKSFSKMVMLKSWRISFSVRSIWSCFLIIATNTGMVVVKEVIFDTDEGIRYDASLEGMAPRNLIILH
jgi:hypothetical protein